MFFKKVIPGSISRLAIVNHEETYGRHILDRVVPEIETSRCVDLGCGNGDDLLIVSKHHPQAELIGVDFGAWNKEKLESSGIKPITLDIEKDKLPFEDDSVDLIIANQIIEHTKEVFWINHEIFRCLRVGGVLFMGVPNLLSLHNRILMLLGSHPTSSKLISAHVRALSRKDTAFFYRTVGASFCHIEKYWGSQFYPFPKQIARIFAYLLPSLATGSFYLIRKVGDYNNEFIKWPSYAKLETNYFTGEYPGK